MTEHQLKQIEVIDKIEQQVETNSLSFSTVSPAQNYDKDSRKCLTSVHLPDKKLLLQIQQTLINPLRKVAPDFYYYSSDSLHMTIKNIRVVNDPPHFNEEVVKKAQKVFSEIITKHQQFQVYFYRLLLFPNNLALVGTTDSELDNIILDLDQSLKKAEIPDDKTYINSRYFFSHMTLARFNSSPPEEFKKKVGELSNSLKFEPYTVDSVTLLSCNAFLKNRQIKGKWRLRKSS